MEQWQWAWLAGLFEGEGYCGFSGKTSVLVRVSMTDKDVIDELNRLCPSATSRPAVRRPANRKVQYVWNRSDRDEVKAFLEGVRPYVFSRRGKRIDAALERLATNPGAKPKRTHCKYGHPLSGENLYVARLTGARSCQICRTRRDKERRARQKSLGGGDPADDIIGGSDRVNV